MKNRKIEEAFIRFSNKDIDELTPKEERFLLEQCSEENETRRIF